MKASKVSKAKLTKMLKLKKKKAINQFEVPGKTAKTTKKVKALPKWIARKNIRFAKLHLQRFKDLLKNKAGSHHTPILRDRTLVVRRKSFDVKKVALPIHTALGLSSIGLWV